MSAEKERIWKTKTTKMRNTYIHYYPEIAAM